MSEMEICGVWVFHQSLTAPQAEFDVPICFYAQNSSGDGADFRMMELRLVPDSVTLTYDIPGSVGDEVVAYNGTKWTDETYRTVDLGEDAQTVSSEFYDWLVANAVNQTAKSVKAQTNTVKGVWVFQESIQAPQSVTQDIVGVSNGFTFNRIYSNTVMMMEETVVVDFIYSAAPALEEVRAYVCGTLGSGWQDEAYRTVDFGVTEQEVSDEFYAWLVANAESKVDNIQINITENGKTTLLTAGKYCDKNVEVNVNVAAEADTRKEDGLITRELKTYTNDRVESVGNGTFRFYTNLEELSFKNVTKVLSNAFYECTALHTAEFGSPVSFGSQSFAKCASLTAVILRGSSISTLSNVNVFNGAPIASGTGYVYVPDDLVAAYQEATNWSAYASQIRSISQLEGQ